MWNTSFYCLLQSMLLIKHGLSDSYQNVKSSPCHCFMFYNSLWNCTTTYWMNKFFYMYVCMCMCVWMSGYVCVHNIFIQFFKYLSDAFGIWIIELIDVLPALVVNNSLQHIGRPSFTVNKVFIPVWGRKDRDVWSVDESHYLRDVRRSLKTSGDLQCLLISWHRDQLFNWPSHHAFAKNINKLFDAALTDSNWFATILYSAQLPSLYSATMIRMMSGTGVLTVTSFVAICLYIKVHNFMNDSRVNWKFCLHSWSEDSMRTIRSHHWLLVLGGGGGTKFNELGVM